MSWGKVDEFESVYHANPPAFAFIFNLLLIMDGKSRRKPNILVTGTPGTGKTSTCEMLAEATGLKHINVGTWVKEKEPVRETMPDPVRAPLLKSLASIPDPPSVQ